MLVTKLFLTTKTKMINFHSVLAWIVGWSVWKKNGPGFGVLENLEISSKMFQKWAINVEAPEYFKNTIQYSLNALKVFSICTKVSVMENCMILTSW